jgi:N-acetylglucosamine malate deacetylase 1
MSWLDSIRRITIVAAHPDDEVLGCGGLIARLVGAGAEASLLTLTGVTSSRAAPLAADVEAEQAAAVRVLGIARSRRLAFPDNRLDTVPLLELVREVEREQAFAPDLVLTHAPGDLNVDHRLAHQATLTAFRPAGAPGPRLLAFETLSSTEWQDPALVLFRPNCWVDISAHLATKLAAMRCYASELRAPPHPRSLEGISAKARSRGFEVGVAAAEAFHIIREVA